MAGVGAGVDSGPSTDDGFGQTVMHRLENVERQEEKEGGIVDINFI